MPRFASLALGLALAALTGVLPATTHAVTTVLCADTAGSSPCPLPGSANPAGDVLDIASANVVENLSTYPNSGTISVLSGGTFDNQFISFGSFFGFLRTIASGSFDSAGSVHNESFFQIEDDATLTIQADTTFDNDFGDLSIYDDGAATNFGTLLNTGAVYLLMDNSNDPPGDPDNPRFENPGSFTNFSGALVLNDGEFLNSGTFTNESSAEFSSSGLLDNTGSFTNDGLLDNTEFDGVGGQITNSGTFIVSTTGDVDGGSAVDPRGDFTQTAGTTRVDGVMWQRNVQIEGGELSGGGEVKGTLSIGTGAGTTPNATLAPGSAADATTLFDVTGDLDLLSDAELALELASLADFDRVVATGDATLDGTLRIALDGGYEPALADSFVIVSGNTRTGSFATTVFPTFSGKTFELSMDATSATVTVVAAGTPVPSLGPLGLGLLSVLLLGAGLRARSPARAGALIPSGASSTRPGASSTVHIG